jgi:hypothetical protein
VGKYITQDVVVTINGVDLSEWGFNVDTPQTRDQIDVSGFNATGAKEFLPGQRTDEVTVQFEQDFASGGPHQTLYPLFQGGSAFPISVKPTSAATSATNPALSGSATMNTYNGLSGALNARGEFSATFSAFGTAGLTWGTA